jgi:glycosyltransferase involved in cell wall biosynthesis
MANGMKTEHPLVSIITPSYNQAAYLEFTLRSVLEQGYPNLEYLVVDGGSQDGSRAIIQSYADRLSWWVSEPDQGQADAINKGFARARGEIVAWLNSDDLYLPGAIQHAVQVLQAQPAAGMVYGDALTITAEGSPLNLLKFPEWTLADLLRFRIICQPAVFMRREALAAVGPLDQDFHFMLDHQLWLRLAARFPIAHSPHLLAAARHHPQAKNAAQAEKFSVEILRLLDWVGSEPIFKDQYARDQRQITGGAFRLSARYLLDADLPGPALQIYLQALRQAPAYTLRHWHRMLYALLSQIGLGGMDRWYRRLNRPPDLAAFPQFQGWPGLALNR